MTSPCHSKTNFEDIIKLPFIPQWELEISIPFDDDEEDYWNSICTVRQISLITEKGVKSYTEEPPLTPFPMFEHLGYFNFEKIVKEFRDDEIEFI